MRTVSVRVHSTFEVDERRYEALECLVNGGKDNVTGDDVCERVPDAIGEDDVAYIWSRLDKLPMEFRELGLALVTGKHHHDGVFLQIFYITWWYNSYRCEYSWGGYWRNPSSSRWYGRVLVLRRIQ